MTPISCTVTSGIALVILTAASTAYPGKAFNLQELVKASDVIAIADLSEVSESGRTVITVDGRQVPAVGYSARVRIERRVKGSCPEQFTMAFYITDQFVGYPGVAPGRQMVFLRQDRAVYVFSDRHFPSLPAGPAPIQEMVTDPLEAAISELGRVITLPGAPPANKWAVLAKLRGIPPSESFDKSLRAGMDTTDSPELKYLIQAALISRGDASQMAPAVNTLMGGALSENSREALLLAIGNDVKISASVPPLTRLLRSGAVGGRRAAAEALWHIAVSTSVPALARALRDPDEDVRFYAVRALSDISSDPQWGGPSQSQFHDHEQEYLTHWENWVKTEVQ
jgi:HEAT repeats